MLRPILVEKADVTLGMLGLPEELTKYDSIHNHTSLGGLETKKVNFYSQDLIKKLKLIIFLN